MLGQYPKIREHWFQDPKSQNHPRICLNSEDTSLQSTSVPGHHLWIKHSMAFLNKC